MTGEEFIGVVLDHMPRATPRERRDVARELRDHLEDRAQALGEAGAEAMGDPAEIGETLNAQLSPFWLWLGRVAKALCVIAALGLVYSLFDRFCEVWADVGRWGGWG